MADSIYSKFEVPNTSLKYPSLDSGAARRLIWGLRFGVELLPWPEFDILQSEQSGSGARKLNASSCSFGPRLQSWQKM